MTGKHYGAELPTPDQQRLNAEGWPTASAEAFALAIARGVEPDAFCELPAAPHTLDHLAAIDLL